MAALAAVVGKFHVALDLGADSTCDSIARALLGALAADCWLSVDGTSALIRSSTTWGG